MAQIQITEESDPVSDADPFKEARFAISESDKNFFEPIAACLTEAEKKKLGLSAKLSTLSESLDGDVLRTKANEHRRKADAFKDGPEKDAHTAAAKALDAAAQKSDAAEKASRMAWSHSD
jgi:hypothetical protein